MRLKKRKRRSVNLFQVIYIFVEFWELELMMDGLFFIFLPIRFQFLDS